MTTFSSSTPIQTGRIDKMIDWLATFGPTADGGITRLLYSPSWIEAQQALKKEMEASGLNTSFDDVGNLFGRLEGTDKDAPVILTGSHIDSVINGGKFDGTYGILSSLLAVKNLSSRYGYPKKPIEVVSLCEEEGSRFPLTFWGSGNITGKYANKDIEGICDVDGISLQEAMQEAGFGKGEYRSPYRNDIDCFIELHIEQGNVLETADNSLGIVKGIVGQRRFNIYVKGESNHAGTTPMDYRRDAMSVSSELISFITNLAKELDPNLVATVGKIEAKPNVPNVIAGEVMFTLDVRHHQKEMLDTFCSRMFQQFETLSQRSGLDITSSQWTDVQPVEMDKALTEQSHRISKQDQLPSQYMISGAGHDAQMFGTYCPTSLIFVPSRNGVSHSPEEFTKVEDLQNGVRLLTEILYEIAYEERGRL